MNENATKEILNIMSDTIKMLVEDKENDLAEMKDTMKLMSLVLDDDDVWAYSVGDVTADELYIKVKKAKGFNNHVNHDIFMNVLIDWMYNLNKEDK